VELLEVLLVGEETLSHVEHEDSLDGTRASVDSSIVLISEDSIPCQILKVLRRLLVSLLLQSLHKHLQ
jgi:hypothetical protein